jgi:hypothetical protein
LRDRDELRVSQVELRGKKGEERRREEKIREKAEGEIVW